MDRCREISDLAGPSFNQFCLINGVAKRFESAYIAQSRDKIGIFYYLLPTLLIAVG
jgi:hypothetical protein